MNDHHNQDYLEATMHQFKTHIAHYLRLMETGLYKAVIVKRSKTPVGVFMPYPKGKKPRSSEPKDGD